MFELRIFCAPTLRHERTLSVKNLGVAILLLLACGGCRPRMTVSKETTYFTGPLRPNGSIDYAAALNELYGSGVTPENNAAIPLLAILGDVVPEDVADRMGMRPTSIPSERFLGGFADWPEYIEWRRERGLPDLGTDAEAVGRRLDTELTAAMGRPWSAKDSPLVAEWLEDMEGPLEAIDEATTRPRYWIPVTQPLPGTFLPRLLTRRNVTNALRSRAMLRLSEGNPDEAVRDLLTIFRLASHQARGPTLIDHLIGVAIAGIGAEALPLVAAHPKLSRDALPRTLSELEGLEPISSPAEKIGNFERAWVLDAAVQLAFRGEESQDEIELGFLDRTLADWDEVLKSINRCYDAEIACQEAPTAEARRAACAERDRLLPKDKAREVASLLEGGATPTEKVSFVFRTVVAIALPSLSRTRLAVNELHALDRLGRSALALRVHRQEKGRFPEHLESLSASERYGISVAERQHGYRFAFHPGGAAGYAYTAMPEEPGTSGVRSFCVDGTGELVTLEDGGEPEIQDARCVNVSAQ